MKNINRPTESRDRNRELQTMKDYLKDWSNCLSLHLAGTEYIGTQKEFRAPRYPEWRADRPTIPLVPTQSTFPSVWNVTPKNIGDIRQLLYNSPTVSRMLLETPYSSPIKYQLWALWNLLNVTALGMLSLWCLICTDGWPWLSVRTHAHLSVCLSVPLSVLWTFQLEN
jgi:hypothetical protein